MGCHPCVHPGVWRYPQETQGRQPTFYYQPLTPPTGCPRRLKFQNIIMFFNVPILLLITIALLFAIAGYVSAKKKNRNPMLWAVICFLSDLFGLIVLLCSSPLEYNEELDYSESDTLGWIMLFIAFALFYLSFDYGWNAAKEYNDAMRWKLYMQMMQ